jgi:hypothetical protein
MQLQVGDRRADETGEYEVIGRPYTTNAGRTPTLASRRSASRRSRTFEAGRDQSMNCPSSRKEIASP